MPTISLPAFSSPAPPLPLEYATLLVMGRLLSLLQCRTYHLLIRPNLHATIAQRFRLTFAPFRHSTEVGVRNTRWADERIEDPEIDTVVSMRLEGDADAILIRRAEKADEAGRYFMRFHEMCADAAKSSPSPMQQPFSTQRTILGNAARAA